MAHVDGRKESVKINRGWFKVDWVIRCSEAIRGTPGPEKTDRLCEEQVGVRDCESSDRIKGCDGTCIRAVDSLAGVGGWSITNVTAFIIFGRQ
jgi:hypothetical protein